MWRIGRPGEIRRGRNRPVQLSDYVTDSQCRPEHLNGRSQAWREDRTACQTWFHTEEVRARIGGPTGVEGEEPGQSPAPSGAMLTVGREHEAAERDQADHGDPDMYR